MSPPYYGPAGEEGSTVETIYQPGGGYDVVTNQGAVYAEGGAQYYGGTNTGIGGPVGENIVSAIALPGGGYQLTNAQGQTYNFGSAPGQYNAQIGGYNQPPTSTTPPAGVAMTTDANGNPITQNDAIAILSQELSSWGFGSDAVTWATQQITSNNSIDQILYSLRQQPFYVNSMYGQVMQARQAANLPAMTEAQINSYKDYAVGVMQQAGLPTNFINDQEMVTLMSHDVSTAELDARITQGLSKAIQSPPQVLAALQQYYGVTPGGLAAYFLDPNRALPLLQNQFTSAQIGGAAVQTGYGHISQPQAMAIAQMGKTQADAVTGFTNLAKEAQLFTALPGSGEQGINQEIQLGAEFGGNAADQMAITQRTDQRKAAFSGYYKYAETQGRGITGLGVAPRNG
jgi:hypothetical protein